MNDQVDHGPSNKRIAAMLAHDRDIAETRFARLKPVLDAVTEVIAAKGDEGLPSGHLYAMLLSEMNLDTYNSMIALLCSTGKVTLNSHVLRVTP